MSLPKFAVRLLALTLTLAAMDCFADEAGTKAALTVAVIANKSLAVDRISVDMVADIFLTDVTQPSP